MIKLVFDDWRIGLQIVGDGEILTGAEFTLEVWEESDRMNRLEDRMGYLGWVTLLC